MSRLLGRLGGAAAAHPWRTLAAWFAVLIALGTGVAAAGGSPRDDYRIPGAPSQAAADLLRDRFPAAAGASATVVLHDRAGRRLPGTLVDTAGERLAGVPRAASVSPPRLSTGGDTAILTVSYRVPVTSFTGSEAVDALWTALRPVQQAGVQVELGGEVPENFSAPGGGAEAVGVLAALVILTLALRSLVAAGLPVVVAAGGLVAGTAVVGLLERVIHISSTAPTIASMVGLGVGIDYALLLLGRHVEGLRAGLGTREAAAAATSTAGVSVLLAGSTVLVSLSGVRLATLPAYSSFGYATAAVVATTMAAAVTLVPALCGLAGPRVLARRDRRTAAGTTAGTTARPSWTARWAEAVTARRGRSLLAAAVALAVLLGLAAPVLGMRTWPQDAGSQPTSSTTRRAYDLVAAGFGPGATGRLVVVADLDRLPGGRPGLAALESQLASEPGVATVLPAQVAPSADVAVLVVEPTTAPGSAATRDLLHRLRDGRLPRGALVGGLVAAFADISDRLADRLWTVVAFVVALSLLLLTLLFRAPVVALKAAVMNLLSVAAAYGVMTAVFQTDAGARALGLPHAVPVSSWVPILMFTVLFGLSMDYEVFLLSRVRELWLATGDARGSVTAGLAATARIITSAAAIMVAVFAGFALDADVTVKMTGVGMSVAVLVDASIVRMVLVPAVMSLLGSGNWWLPRWLRWLPHLDRTGGPSGAGGPAGPGAPVTSDVDHGQQRVSTGGR